MAMAGVSSTAGAHGGAGAGPSCAPAEEWAGPGRAMEGLNWHRLGEQLRTPGPGQRAKGQPRGTSHRGKLRRLKRSPAANLQRLPICNSQKGLFVKENNRSCSPAHLVCKAIHLLAERICPKSTGGIIAGLCFFGDFQTPKQRLKNLFTLIISVTNSQPCLQKRTPKAFSNHFAHFGPPTPLDHQTQRQVSVGPILSPNPTGPAGGLSSNSHHPSRGFPE